MPPKFELKKPDPVTPGPSLSQLPKFITTPSRTETRSSDGSIFRSSKKVLRAMSTAVESPLRGENVEDGDTLSWTPPIKRLRTYKKQGGLADIVQNLAEEEEQKIQLEGHWKNGVAMRVIECTRVNRQVMNVKLERMSREPTGTADKKRNYMTSDTPEMLETGIESSKDHDSINALLLIIDSSQSITIGDTVRLGRPLTESPVSYLDWGMENAAAKK